ncbi:hypothetical protein, conserved [Eimeria tenella]|uniref:Uncharacterized protein n=1 Tax=Eimeria tenella TaxID=5802 RepID=U6L633_EIMTE|nr:hypothetical protein, conserved [Eimeria tenella]CDJ44029.1 hypothetical protein, conserved [Eimeria tenella]|eukprot:XP_013234778.1 hypothetical protein, conserved [Eimeria tenella]
MEVPAYAGKGAPGGPPEGFAAAAAAAAAARSSKDQVGGKVPQYFSLRGSNALRGGRRTYNAMCLNDNWYEDRLNPELAPQLQQFAAAEQQQQQRGPFGPWASEYTVAYSRGNWKLQNFKLTDSNILAFDQSSPQDWTSCYRIDYRNRQQEEVMARMQELEEEKRKREMAEMRARAAAEARVPVWPLTPEAAARLAASRQHAEEEAAASHRSQHSAASGGAAAAAAAAAAKGQQQRSGAKAPAGEERGPPRLACSSSKQDFDELQLIKKEEIENPEEELERKMTELEINPHDRKPAGKPSQAQGVRFAGRYY